LFGLLEEESGRVLEVFHDKSEEGFGFKYFENGKFVKL
jgi:hypothetical protein